MHVNTCEILCCPTCRGTVEPVGFARGFLEEGALICRSCHTEYPVRAGIPIFIGANLSVDSTGDGFSEMNEEIRQKVLQREWHDRERLDREYKRAAYGSQTLFSFVLYYQMREAFPLLATGKTSLVANICAGHGFELEFLSKFSGSIVAIDISWNSLRLALERARELGLKVEAICADAENLPLRDNSFDLVFTHQSLHHLPRPLRGLEEMLRTSRRRVACFEPAKGVTRTVLTALGIKPAVEESGNFVYEFDLRSVEKVSSKQNVRLQHFRKCLITGLADEPDWFHRMDSLHLTPLLRGAVTFANRLVGNLLGTKCTVILEKDSRGPAAIPFSSVSPTGAGMLETSHYAQEVQPAKH